jgi:hypothetical protein
MRVTRETAKDPREMASSNRERRMKRTGSRSGKRDASLNDALEKEAWLRLRKAPIAGAPIPGERGRDLQRLAEIRARQKQVARDREMKAGPRRGKPK